MAEILDLTVLKALLSAQFDGEEVARVRKIRLVRVRSLAADDFSSDVASRHFGIANRQSKMLTLALEPYRLLISHMMLTGALQHCTSDAAGLKRMFFILSKSDMDQRQMGMVYCVRPDKRPHVPWLEEQGPDACDDGLYLEEFRPNTKPYDGEIRASLPTENS